MPPGTLRYLVEHAHHTKMRPASASTQIDTDRASFVPPRFRVFGLPATNICRHSRNSRELHAATSHLLSGTGCAFRHRQHVPASQPRGRRKLLVIAAKMVAAEPPGAATSGCVSTLQVQHGRDVRRQRLCKTEERESFEAQVGQTSTATDLQVNTPPSHARLPVNGATPPRVYGREGGYHDHGKNGASREHVVPCVEVEMSGGSTETLLVTTTVDGLSSGSTPDCCENRVHRRTATLRVARARRQRDRRRRDRATVAARKRLVKEVAALGKKGRWKEALAAADAAIADGLPPHLYVHSSCLGAVAHSGRWREALDLLRKMRSDGFHPTTAVYNAAIHACGVGGQWKLSLRLLREMRNCENLFFLEETGMVGSEVGKGCLSVAGDSLDNFALGQCSDIEGDDRPQPDTQTFNTVMSACGRAGEWRLALDVMKVMQDHCLLPDKVTYNTAISACAKGGETDAALELVEQMAEAGCIPDAFTYNSAISACARNGMWERALSLLGQMKASAGVQPDAFSFSSAITACGKAGQWELALGMLDAMIREGVRPGKVAFNAAIDACGKGGQWERAVGLLREMQTAPTFGAGEGQEAATLVPDVVSYNAAIKACGEAGKWERAISLLEEMRLSGVDADHDMENDQRRSRVPMPDVVSYSTVIAACGRAGNWNRALGLLEQMRGEGLTPTPSTFTAAITACRKGGQARLVLHLLDRMREYKVTPDTICYGAALRACAEAALCKSARGLLAEMEGRNIEIDAAARRAATVACAGSNSACYLDGGDGSERNR